MTTCATYTVLHWQHWVCWLPKTCLAHQQGQQVMPCRSSCCSLCGRKTLRTSSILCGGGTPQPTSCSRSCRGHHRCLPLRMTSMAASYHLSICLHISAMPAQLTSMSEPSTVTFHSLLYCCHLMLKCLGWLNGPSNAHIDTVTCHQYPQLESRALDGLPCCCHSLLS